MKNHTLLLLTLLALELAAHGQNTEAEWKQEAIQKYPDLARAGTPMNKRYASEYHGLRKHTPEYFNLPDWPLLLAHKVYGAIHSKPVSAKIAVQAIATAAPAVARATLPPSPPAVQLVSINDVKRYWIANLPRVPGTLDPGFHKISAQNWAQTQRINNGAHDDEAQDQANAQNIAALQAAGRFQDADSLLNQRAVYQQQLARAEMAHQRQEMSDTNAEFQQQISREARAAQNESDQLQSELAAQQQEIAREMQAQRREMADQRREIASQRTEMEKQRILNRHNY